MQNLTTNIFFIHKTQQIVSLWCYKFEFDCINAIKMYLTGFQAILTSEAIKNFLPRSWLVGTVGVKLLYT